MGSPRGVGEERVAEVRAKEKEEGHSGKDEGGWVFSREARRASCVLTGQVGRIGREAGKQADVEFSGHEQVNGRRNAAVVVRAGVDTQVWSGVVLLGTGLPLTAP